MRTVKAALAPSILRAYDIRGVVGEDFGEDDLFAIGRAFGSEMAERGLKTACVGYDGRLSSPALEEALVEGLTACGIDVLRSGRGPSPMLYYATYALKADAGLMITGSHNPPEFNAVLKMTLGGKAFFDEDIQGLGRRVAAGDYVDGAGSSKQVDVFDDYVARIAADYTGAKDLRVAWDPGNGAAGEVTDALTAKLPGTHFVINSKIDGTFPAHHPDPTVEKNLTQLKELVAANDCDLGIGFDGDGDRIGVVDREGNVMWGDQLLVMVARDVLDHPGAPILCDVKASRVFFDEIKKMGGEPVMWKAGHSHIKSKMAELNSPLAGEMSAHIFFKHRYYGYDDAVYTAVRLLSVVASSDRSFTGMLAALPVMYNTPEIRFDCPDDRKFTVVDEITARARTLDGVEIFDMDGVRAETAYGWWLLRASNTQPMLVVRCESDTADGLERLKDDVRAQLALSSVDASAI